LEIGAFLVENKDGEVLRFGAGAAPAVLTARPDLPLPEEDE
jgi:hypothetical protein